MVIGNTLEFTLYVARADPAYCDFGDSDFNRYIPFSHLSYVEQQISVLHASVCIYIVAFEAEVLCTVLLRRNATHLEKFIEALNEVALQFAKYAHCKH